MTTLCLTLLATVFHWAVEPISSEMRLPDRDPSDGIPNGTVTIRAARGEYEPGSFVLKSDRDLGKVRLEIGEFKQVEGGRPKAGGRVFPRENIDLKVVKVWYQDRNAWFSYFGDTEGVKLCPELLLHDEDLIRVDLARQANYARLTAKDGKTREVWISAPRQFHQKRPGDPYWMDRNFNAMSPEFGDAETLQPVTLAKDFRKQFFLTVKTGKDTPAGVYEGKILLSAAGPSNAGGPSLGSIPVRIEVLPFTLGRPKCYVRPDQDFQIAYMNYYYIDIFTVMNGGDRELAKEQLRKIFAAHARHGETSLLLRGTIGTLGEQPKDLHGARERFEYLWQIDAAKRAGMRTDVIFGGQIPDMHNYFSKNLGYDLYRQAAQAARDWVDATLGKDVRVFSSFGDEPGPQWMMRFRPLFEAGRDSGFSFLLAGWWTNWGKGVDLLDWHTVGTDCTNPTLVGKWNQVANNDGGRNVITSWYACMHAGVEDPALQRRQNGLPAYLTGNTGLMNYAHHAGPYYDDSTRYRPMVMAYGCRDGVLDTIQWEGMREGIDDIRYASYLKALADRACSAKPDSTVRAGRRALAYLADLDRYNCDLVAARAEIVNEIGKLLPLVGELPEEKPLPACKDFAIPEDPVLAAAKAEVNREEELRREYGRADIWWLRDRLVKGGVAAVDEGLALMASNRNTRATGPLDRYELDFYRETLARSASVTDRGTLVGLIAATDGKLKGDLSDAQRMERLEFIGTTLLKLGREEFCRALWDYRATIVKPQKKLVYDVAWRDEEIWGPRDWERAGAPEEPLARKFGDNDLSFLVTDVSTGARAADAKASGTVDENGASFAVIADAWGVHFRFTDRNPDAAKIGVQAASGRSWEIYLAPGSEAPYAVYMPGQSVGNPGTFWNTTYSTFGVRRIPNVDEENWMERMRTENRFYHDRVATYLDLSWANYFGFLKDGGMEWDFEPVRWGAGNVAWNGLKGIHSRSTWGTLRFDIPEKGMTDIRKRLLLAGKAKFGEAINELHWTDETRGDLDFWETCLKPLKEEFKPVLAAITYEMEAEKVKELSGKYLGRLMDLGYEVQRLRARYLRGDFQVKKHPTALPVIDITGWTNGQFTVAAGTADRETGYQGHPSMYMRLNGDPMFCVWTIGHGGKCGPFAYSKDRGRTWIRDDARMPENWAKDYSNCPTVRSLEDRTGLRLFIFSRYDKGEPVRKGMRPVGFVYSDDRGRKWKEGAPTKLCGNMAPTGFLVLANGDLALFGQMPKDPENFKDRSDHDQAVWMSVSKDRGLTWGEMKVIAQAEGRNLCEPFAIRSPDGKSIAVLMRENRHLDTSFLVVSSDEGATWSAPRKVSEELAGDRHEGFQLGDRRLFFAFRDRKPGSATAGQFVAWVGTWEDLVSGRPGQYRIHLLKHCGTHGVWPGNEWDTGYPALGRNGERLTCITYSKTAFDDRYSSVVGTTFDIREVDKIAKPLIWQHVTW